MSSLAQSFHVDYTEPDMVAEASEDASYQAPRWRNFNYWTPEAINRNIKAAIQGTDRDDVAPNELTSDWLDRQNVFKDEERQVIQFPPFVQTGPRGSVSVNTLEEWDCVVSDVTQNTVYADAKPLIEQSGSKVLLEFPIVEFAKSDRQNLIPGLMFRYIICWSKRESGTVAREAFTYIRRVQRRIITDQDRQTLDSALSMLDFDVGIESVDN